MSLRFVSGLRKRGDDMARKTQAQHGSVKIAAFDKKFIERQEARLEELEPGSAEARAWNGYLTALRAEAEAEARVAVLAKKVEGQHLIPDKFRDAWNRLLSARDAASRRANTALFGFDALCKNVFTVPEKEVRQVVIDALNASAEAWPVEEDAIPMHRQHLFSKLAEEIVTDLKTAQVKVRENAKEVPMCDACTEELAA